MKDVFLSHSSKDHDATLSLHDDLSKLGFTVWYDKVELGPGDSLLEKIGHGLHSSMNLAVVLSKNSVISRWVTKEVSIAVTGQLAGAKVNVIPILIEDCDIPPFLSDIVYADLRPTANQRLEFANLAKMLWAASPQGVLPLRLVSRDAVITADATHSPAYDAGYLTEPTDESSRDSRRSYWLLPDKTAGTTTMKLRRGHSVELMRIVNTQNQIHKDRAAKEIRIRFLTAGSEPRTVWSGGVPPYPERLTLWFDSIYAEIIEIQVCQWTGLGGGLNCVEVYAAD